MYSLNRKSAAALAAGMYDPSDTRMEEIQKLKRINERRIQDLAACRRSLRRTRAQLHQCQLKLKSAEFKNKKYLKEITTLSNLLEETSRDNKSGYEDYVGFPIDMFDRDTEMTTRRTTEASADEKKDSYSENFLPYKLKL